MPKVEATLAALGFTLPTPSIPPARYTPSIAHAGMIYISGQPPYWDGRLEVVGKVGRELSLADGVRAARISTLNVLAHLRLACEGDLDQVIGCIRMQVMVNADENFSEVHKVADGASTLIADLFPSATAPTRSSFGCSVLPMNIATEVEAAFAIRRS